MKKNIIISALCAMSLNACVLNDSDTSNYHMFPQLVEFKAESRFEYPMVMVETAMSIEAFEAMSPEEKMTMGYIYDSALATGESRYKMNEFYGFTLDMYGMPLSEQNSEWVIKTDAGSFDRYFTQTTMRLSRTQGSDYEYRLACDYKGYQSYEILFSHVDETPAEGNDVPYYSWIIEMSCNFTTDDGNEVTVKTLGPVTRKVYRAVPGISDCYVVMKGALEVRFEGDSNDDGQLEVFDVVKYEYHGERQYNEIYQF